MKKTFLFTAFGKSIQVTNEDTSCKDKKFVSETDKYFGQTIIDNIPSKIFSVEEMDILCMESDEEFMKHLTLDEQKTAFDLFDEYPQEFIKYAKTKGMVTLDKVKRGIELSQEEVETGIGVYPRYTMNEIIELVTK